MEGEHWFENVEDLQEQDFDEKTIEPSSPPIEEWRGRRLPVDISLLKTLNNAEKVGSLAFSSPNLAVFTSGKGCVKVWDINRPPLRRLIYQLGCFNKETEIRAMKVTPDGETLLVGGDAHKLIMYDLSLTSTPQIRAKLPLGEFTCYALTVSPDSKLCYCCHTNGDVTVWDLHNQYRIHRLRGHVCVATCIDISDEGLYLWTGGVDKRIRSWDLRKYKETRRRRFESPVYSISRCPTGEWLAVGLRSGLVELVHDYKKERQHCIGHLGPVRGLKFSHDGRWFLTGGEDGQVGGWSTPYAATRFLNVETSSVTCCEISADDTTIVTGSLYKVSMYGVVH